LGGCGRKGEVQTSSATTRLEHFGGGKLVALKGDSGKAVWGGGLLWRGKKVAALAKGAAGGEKSCFETQKLAGGGGSFRRRMGGLSA